MGAEFFHADRQTDRQTDKTKLIAIKETPKNEGLFNRATKAISNIYKKYLVTKCQPEHRR